MQPLITKILCATDFSESAEHAFHFALGLAKQHGATVELLHVTEPSVYSEDVISSQCENFAACLLERLQTLLAATELDGVAVSPKVRSGVACVEIVRRAGELPADLLVLGTHGRTGLQHLLIGSVAEKVVRTAACPVLTIRHPRHQVPAA